MFETTHRQTIKNETYEYPAIKSAVRINGKYKSYMRTYGLKRTKEQAVELVEQWESENPPKYKKRLSGGD